MKSDQAGRKFEIGYQQLFLYNRADLQIADTKPGFCKQNYLSESTINAHSSRIINIQTEGVKQMSRKQRVQALIFGFVTMAVLALVVMKPVEAAGTFIVSNTNDNGSGSLRQAIMDANAAAGGTINFAAGVTGTIDLLTALPDLGSNITINGPGASILTVERSYAMGTPDFGVFTINSFTTVAINGLTIKNGKPIFGPGRAYGGGGIYNLGSLTITNCIIANNTADFGSGIGIFSAHTLTITNSAIINNSARDHSAGSGIFCEGLLIIDNCIIANNSAESGSGMGIFNKGTTILTNSAVVNNSVIKTGVGTGLYNVGNLTATNCTIANNTTGNGSSINNQGTITLNNSTVANNSAVIGVGISTFGVLNLQSTIVAKNFPTDISGEIDSLGHNLIGNTAGNSGWDTSKGDLINIDPLFEFGIDGKPLLKDNGGHTKTIALLCGSPAIDQGKNLSGLTTDQRGAGFARSYDDSAIANAIKGDGTDIGAFELQGCFDLCLQNEGSNASLQINSQTGDYRFCCGGQSFVGRGTVTSRGGMVTLQDNNGNRRFLARIDRASNQATASLQSPPGTMLCTISGRVNTNHSCRCVLPSAPQ